MAITVIRPARLTSRPINLTGRGGGAPDWVETVEVADPYRGRFGYDDAAAGPSYAASVDGALTALGDRGINCAVLSPRAIRVSEVKLSHRLAIWPPSMKGAGSRWCLHR